MANAYKTYTNTNTFKQNIEKIKEERQKERKKEKCVVVDRKKAIKTEC